MLRQRRVVSKFVEFYGPGLANLPLADRATIGNMSPEYGATCGIFPVDAETLRYLRVHRPPGRAGGARRGVLPRAGPVPRAGRAASRCSPTRSSSTWRPSSRAWPGRAGRRTASPSADAASDFREELRTFVERRGLPGLGHVGGADVPGERPAVEQGRGRLAEAAARAPRRRRAARSARATREGLDHGAVVIAAITSCTNTSNPSVMLGAGLLARKAVEAGLARRPWVKTSLAPGSKVVTEYLERAGLIEPLERLGFSLVGYGCTTCIGNSRAAAGGDLARDRRARPDGLLGAVGQPQLRGAHPPRGQDELPRQPAARAWPTRWRGGWTSTSRASRCRATCAWPTSGRRSARSPTRSSRRSSRTCSARSYGEVFAGDENWNALEVPAGDRYAWDPRVDLRQAPALLRRHGRRAGGGLRPRSPARGRSRCSATASRPTTSRPPARSRRDSPAGRYLRRARRRARATSTPTAHGAATTR